MEGARERRILVAVDESEESMYALKWAVHHLHLHSTDTLILCHSKWCPISYVDLHSTDTLILCHSKWCPISYVGLGGPWYVLTLDVAIAIQKYQERVNEAVMEKARDICRGCLAKVEEKIVKENAGDALCDSVEKARADFIVIGSHGYGTFKRTLMGSVSDFCVHHAMCPVMVVKKPTTEHCVEESMTDNQRRHLDGVPVEE